MTRQELKMSRVSTPCPVCTAARDPDTRDPCWVCPEPPIVAVRVGSHPSIKWTITVHREAYLSLAESP